MSKADARAGAHRVLVRHLPGSVVLLAAALLAGCSGSAASDLSTPLQQARAAVVSDQQGFRLLAAGRQTSAAAQVLTKDMADELVKTVSSVAQVQVTSASDAALRDEALAAVNSATAAGLQARDCLSASLPCDRAMAQLNQAAVQVQSALGHVEQMQ